MRLNRFFSSVIFCLLIAMAGISSLPMDAAAQTCNCWCTSEGGAISIGPEASPDECRASCGVPPSGPGLEIAALDREMIVCATSLAQSPDRGPRCFTQAQCIDAGEKRRLDCVNQGGTNCDRVGATWSSVQARECAGGQRYCYPKEPGYTLGIALGNVRVVEGIGGYIRNIYSFLLGIAVTISIVFVMIGGLQYVLAAGSGQTQKAKERISNAVVGLVLLFAAYVILFTVNPNLVSLQVPKFPMIKRVEIISDQSCEQLLAEGFKLDESKTESYRGVASPDEQACGFISPVLSDAGDSPVAEGTTCSWATCPERGQGCANLPDGPTCMKCEEVVGSIIDKFSSLKPSPQTCEMLSISTTAGDGYPAIQDRCYMTNDPKAIISKYDYAWLAAGPFTLGASVVAGVGSGEFFAAAEQIFNSGVCARIQLDCSRILTCEHYTDVMVSSGETTTKLSDMWANLNSQNMQTICESDPCEVRRKTSSVSGRGCRYVPNASEDFVGFTTGCESIPP